MKCGKKLKNRPGSAKYLIIAMQNTLHCITGCTLTLSDKQIHALRLQLARLEAWDGYRNKGAYPEIVLCVR